jgi:hypothetical protein
MKSSKLALLTLAALSAGKLLASTPVLTDVPIDHVFVPKGFHSHENAEIVITGFLPNLCHRAPQTSVSVVGDEIRVQVRSLYYEINNPFCPMVLVPFVETVSLGVMDKGNYPVKINVNTPYELKSNITIEEYVSDAYDDLVFANVTHVEDKGAERKVLLKGYNPSDCFVLDAIEYDHNELDTYSVYPKMKQISNFCPQKMVPFEYEFTVPTDLKRSRVLLHVKALDGNSVNSIFSTQSLEEI